MKLYVLRRKCATLCTDDPYYAAFTDYENAKIEMQYKNVDFPDGYHDEYYIEIVDLPFIGRHVYFIQTYQGYDYDFYNRIIYDVILRSKVYPCSEYAKHDIMWERALTSYNKSKADFYIDDNRIASLDYREEPFSYGDVIEARFNTEIRKIRVNKSKPR